ncbi:MAG: bifunctional folylpolyglutamate synthase/dihydrofolate synthase [Omnitrophica WOR_2 bacterium]
MNTQASEQEIFSKIAGLSVPTRMGVKNSLAPITALMDRLDHPERKFHSVHVGGTSGKGSTSTFIADILVDAGYKVGLFTKPHLSTVRERFVLNGEPIAPFVMLNILEWLGPRIQLDDKPTWFELMTALAFEYFYEQQVDLAVIEVGLGGMFDATNILVPDLSVLTNVGLDHTDILGSTLEEIAGDKVGIFKPAKPVVSGVTQPAIIEIVEKQCRQTGSPLELLGRDFNFSNVRLNQRGSQFDFSFKGECIQGYKLRMLGQHQVYNAAVALASIFTLQHAGYPVPLEATCSGLQRARIPGRMEVVDNLPAIVLDGAHSPPKMAAFAAALKTLFPEKGRLIAVLACSKGHDAEATLAPLAQMLSAAIVTEFSVHTDYGIKRAQPAGELAALVNQLNPGIELHVQPDPWAAVQQARELADPGDLICVTGSIYLVGQVRGSLIANMGGQ